MTRADLALAELLSDLFDLARRDALDVHLRQGQTERLLDARAALQGLRVERVHVVRQVASLGHAKVELAETSRDAFCLVSVGVAHAVLAAFPRTSFEVRSSFQAHGFVEEHLKGAGQTLEPMLREQFPGRQSSW